MRGHWGSDREDPEGSDGGQIGEEHEGSMGVRRGGAWQQEVFLLFWFFVSLNSLFFKFSLRWMDMFFQY